MHKMRNYFGIGEAATALVVSFSTQRRWDVSGKLKVETTCSGYRRFDLAKLRPDLFHAGNDIQHKTIACARVSSHDQKADLERQKQVLEIISVISVRLYGARSRKNQKLLDHVRNAVEQSQC